MSEHNPQLEQFLIGKQPNKKLADGTTADNTIIGILKQHGTEVNHNRSTPILGVVRNTGTESLTFAILESSDNGVSDTYSAYTVRHNKASATTITVVAGGIAHFLIEDDSENFLRLQATENAQGSVMLYWIGDTMERRDCEGVK